MQNYFADTPGGAFRKNSYMASITGGNYGTLIVFGGYFDASLYNSVYKDDVNNVHPKRLFTRFLIKY